MLCVELLPASQGNTLQVSSDVPSCGPNQLVLVSYQEFTSIPKSPFVMSVADGAELSSLILLVWLAGASARWAIRALSSKEGDS